VGFADTGGAGWIDFVGPSGPSGPTSPTLTVLFGAEFLAHNHPGPTLSPTLLLGPTALPLYDLVPPRYALQQAYHWQASETVALPPGASGGPPLAGQPSILMFPPALLDAVASSAAGPTGPTPPYRLTAAATLSAAEAQTRELSAYSWASAIQLRVRQVPAPGGSPLANGYQVVGADQTGRDLLLSAWSFLEGAYAGDGRVYLLYTPNPASSRRPRPSSSRPTSPPSPTAATARCAPCAGSTSRRRSRTRRPSPAPPTS
jgi:hypothetical protein